MAYADLAAVQRHLPFTAGAGSTPTSTQVGAFIDATYNEINSALASQGYSVPVTGPAYWLADLTALNAIGAAAYSLTVGFPQESGPGQVAEGPVLMGIYTRRLEDFKEGRGIPDEAEKSTSISGPRNYFTDNGSIGEDVDVEDAWGDPIDSSPIFKVGMRPL